MHQSYSGDRITNASKVQGISLIVIDLFSVDYLVSVLGVDPQEAAALVKG